jgi:hypothetical protein
LNLKNKVVRGLLIAGILVVGGLHLTKGSLHKSQALPGELWDGGEGGGSRERICHGSAIGDDCRQRNSTKSGCQSCVSFECDANCDSAMDYFFCVAAGNSHCSSLPDRYLASLYGGVITVSHEVKQKAGGCGGDPNRVRPEGVVRAWSIGRRIVKLLEKGEIEDAYALLDRLFAEGEGCVALEGPVRGKPVTELDKKARPLGRMLQICLLVKDKESARALVDLCALKEAWEKNPVQSEDLNHLRAWAESPGLNLVVKQWIQSVVVDHEPRGEV